MNALGVFATRWLVDCDLAAVAAIEEASHVYPADADELRTLLRQRNTMGLVVEHDGQVIGFAIYRHRRGQTEILDIAITPVWRRFGLGTALVDKLKQRVSAQRRTRLSVLVWERNVAACCFFRECGFRTRAIWRKPFAGYRTTGTGWHGRFADGWRQKRLQPDAGADSG